MSEGTNRLIQQGAKLVTCGQDVLEEYWSRFPLEAGKLSAPLTPEAARQRLERQEERTGSARSSKESRARGERGGAEA